MNELKTEDVMRALELHADCETDNCFECPYEKYLSKADGNCVHHLSMDALALIREKDAEIERLQGALKAEERHNELTMECAKKALANARAEAISEFANLFDKAVSNTFVHYGWYIKQIIIPKIAKEMRGEQT